MSKEKHAYDVQYNTAFWRYEFAGRALEAMISDDDLLVLGYPHEQHYVHERARLAVVYADALIEELTREDESE